MKIVCGFYPWAKGVKKPKHRNKLRRSGDMAQCCRRDGRGSEDESHRSHVYTHMYIAAIALFGFRENKNQFEKNK